jgi:TPP-dependent indolepyruvate ferredoxin oxidoreductase alpha subunit
MPDIFKQKKRSEEKKQQKKESMAQELEQMRAQRAEQVKARNLAIIGQGVKDTMKHVDEALRRVGLGPAIERPIAQEERKEPKKVSMVEQKRKKPV